MDAINFDDLNEILQSLNTVFSKQAKASINVCLTLRNWLFGLYIHEYQQAGNDRATYGEFTLKQLSQQLKKTGIPGPQSEIWRFTESSINVTRRFCRQRLQNVKH